MTSGLFSDFMQENFKVSKKILDLGNTALKNISNEFEKIDYIAEYNQMKVLNAMQKNKLGQMHFNFSTGYGYDDEGRDITEKIYADIFHAQDALVRTQIVSGTHALSCALFGNLKYADELIYVTGEPYDTLKSVIGIKKTTCSLIEHGIKYKQVDLNQDGNFDFDAIKNSISPNTKIIAIQRSRGYSLRKSVCVAQIKKLIEFIKNIRNDIICLVDNCYGEFVEEFEPSDFGADLTVGSLIKNPGGGLAKVGGYIVGKKEYVQNSAYHLTAPGIGKEVGPSLGQSSSLLQGLFFAPQTVSCAMKTAVFAAEVFKLLNFEVFPKTNDFRTDIVQAVNMKSKQQLIKFCEGIQKSSPVDSFVLPNPWPMPGYDCDIIMAAGTFVQGSSIEFTADAPIKPPYTVFLQGSLSWLHSKNALLMALDWMNK
jgi:Cystathionine beta-lyase family protein involved in aluminum resistance